MYSNELVCQLITYIDQHLNEEITIDHLSQVFFFNKFYIMKKFKKEIGISIISYINTMRIFFSLFDFNKDFSISAIGYQHGFSSLEYYSETFHKVMGVAPSIYQKFTLFTEPISEEEFYMIRNKLFELQSFRVKVTRYLEKRKPPTLPKKALSIFER